MYPMLHHTLPSPVHRSSVQYLEGASNPRATGFEKPRTREIQLSHLLDGECSLTFHNMETSDFLLTAEILQDEGAGEFITLCL